MKNLILFLLLATGLMAQTSGAGQVAVFGPKGDTTTGTVTSVNVTTANGVSATGGPITTSGSFTFSLGAITPTSVNGNIFTTGSSTYTGTAGQTYTFPTTTASIARIDAAQTFSGVETFLGSFIRTPATITITANAGPLDITLGDSLASNNANTSITMSALGTSGQQLRLFATNSDTGVHTWTINNVSGTDPTFIAPAGLTTVVTLRSDGTGFSILGGAPSIVDLAPNTSPASTDVIAAQNPTTGLTSKSTLAQIATATGVLPHSISFTVSGGGSPLVTGVQDVIINSLYGGTLTSWSVTASPADTITFDILRSADGGAAPSASIVGGSGTKPNLASGVNGHSTSFSSWTSTTVTAYDNFKCQITAVGGTATAATVTLYFQ